MNGSRSHGTCRLSRQPSARRQQTFQQARSHRQCLPSAGRSPHARMISFDLIRGESSRTDRSAASMSRATVYRTLQWMVEAGIARKVDFGEGRFAVRALVSAPAPLPSDLQVLQSIVRVPQLRHRIAARGSRRGAKLYRASKRAADSRDVRIVPDRPARRRSRAGRPSWSLPATR